MKTTTVEDSRAQLARIASSCQLLGQLCELSPRAEPISLETLEVVFKDIAEVCRQANLNLTP